MDRERTDPFMQTQRCGFIKQFNYHMALVSVKKVQIGYIFSVHPPLRQTKQFILDPASSHSRDQDMNLRAQGQEAKNSRQQLR